MALNLLVDLGRLPRRDPSTAGFSSPGHGVLPATGPVWYELLQAGTGVVQFLIGLAMIGGYRRSEPWGAC
jgi:hypothetical protein